MICSMRLRNNKDEFVLQSALKEMRSIDDKIVYAINQSIPTASFKGQVDPTGKCKDLHEQVRQLIILE